VSLIILVGLAAGATIGLTTGLWYAAPLAAWDVAAALYVIWVWLAVHKLSGEQTAKLATHEDPTHAAADAILIFASLASLGAVGLLLGHSDDSIRIAQAALAAASIILSWTVVHTIFTLRYARIYHASPKGGVDFGSDGNPDYHDFAYLAFTVGMTFQVSDTGLRTKDYRRTVLRQALLSYLFGTVFVASTINLIAGLSQ
jgi:uncharacterized membrane protein